MSFPPIDIAYLSAYLERHGHEVFTYDFNVELPLSNDADSSFWGNMENQKKLLIENKEIVEKWIARILDFNPQVVGMSVWDIQLYFSAEVAKLIKTRRPEIKIVFGGAMLSKDKGLYFVENEYYLDYAVYGEGERTLCEIVDSDNLNGPIPGCIRKIDGKVIEGKWREQLTDLDSIPFPDYTSFSFDKYLNSTTYPILLNRGCNWRCSFCVSHLHWNRFRSRSAENVFAEMQHCLLRYPFVDRFQSCDHALNSNMVELEKLCDLIIVNNMKFRDVAGFGQVNPLMIDREVLKKLKKAGFHSWGIGVESGSDLILKSMRKPYTAEMAEGMLKEMHNQGFNLYIGLIVGYPLETAEIFQETVEFVSRIAKYVCNICLSPCGVADNDLGRFPEKYGIHALNQANLTWESDCSTPTIRAKRYEFMVDYLESLGIQHRSADSDREHFSDGKEKNP